MKAIILAGGHSVRFGKPKAFAEVNGETFYSRVIKTLESTNMFNEIIISTNAQLATQFQYPNVVIDDENHNDKGPLAGIYTIMKQHPEEELFFVVSVDTPMITGKAVSTLYQFLVSPTIAFYSPNALGAITKALHSDNYSFKNVYHELSTDYLDVRDVDAPSYWYKNINYQHDLDALIQKL